MMVGMEGKKNLEESILNWYEFRRKASLLEIAAEEDSLASLFQRRCDQVKRIGSPEELYALSPEASAPSSGPFFDYIVAFDWLEKVSDPASFLRQCLAHLKDQGTLLIRETNRFGLKYFCGCGEKYSGLPFEGINGYICGETEKRCYGKKELLELIRAASAENVKFYYPVPDGRMPQMIFTDRYQKGQNAAERLIDYNYEDPSMVGLEHRVFAPMIDGGALGFLSNDYLVEITKGAPVSDILYAVVTTDRGKDLGMATTVREGGQVIKRPLHPEGEEKLGTLFSLSEELKEKGVPIVELKLSRDAFGLKAAMPYIEDEGLTYALEGMLPDQPGKFDGLLDEIYENILKSCSREKGRERVFLDLAPCNAFYHQGHVLFYDQEFVLEGAGPDFAMYRTLKYFFASSRKAREFKRPEDLYEKYQIDPEKIPAFEELEDRFIGQVRKKDQYRWLYQLGTPSFPEVIGKMKAMKRGRKPYHIGYVPGVFDLLHKGHLRLLERCKERCDILIVGVLTDELVEYYKGKKPVISYEDRAELLAGLTAVDQVIPVDFSNTDKLKAWDQLHYDCHFSGDDHIGHWNDVWEELKKRGSNMEFFSYTEGISSSKIRRSMQG